VIGYAAAGMGMNVSQFNGTYDKLKGKITFDNGTVGTFLNNFQNLSITGWGVQLNGQNIILSQ